MDHRLSQTAMTDSPPLFDLATEDALLRAAFNDFHYVEQTIYVQVANTVYQVR